MGAASDVLRLRTSPSVVSALLAASQLQTLPPDVRQEAATYATQDAVPWPLLRRVCRALRAGTSTSSPRPWLQDLARSGGLQLQSPVPRPRHPELERRAARLRIEVEERAYQSLVRDVIWKQRQERERVPLSGTAREVGFGVHIITVMAACFLAFWALGMRLFRDPGMQFMLGAVGLLAGLVVETLLFSIKETRRTSSLPPARPAAPGTVKSG